MSKIIERQPVSGFIDHDYKKVESFTIQGKIEWFEYRFNKILLNPIKAIDKIIKKDRQNSNDCPLENEDTSVFTIIILTMCVGIDLLGGLLSGKQGDTTERDFKYFVDNYLDREKRYPQNPYSNIGHYSTLLYKLFRCGLAHNLAIKQVGFGYGDEYFRKEDGNYYISVDKLIDDLKQSFTNYMDHVRRDNNGLQKKFESRFKHIFIERA